MKSLITIGYVTAYLLYTLTLITVPLRWNNLSRFLSVAALLLNAIILAAVSIVSGQPPVFEGFSGLLFIAFVLGFLGTFFCPKEERRLSVRAWVWMEVLLLFGIMLFFTKEPPPHRFHHTYLWVVLFHGFRGIALSFALFSAAHFIRFRMEPERRRANNPLFGQGRNSLLLSALAFLCGEYAGIVWCQNGWGDFWHWSPAFFQSTLIILCLMFAFHIPGKNPRSDDLRSVVAIMTPLVMLTVVVVKGVS
ncbi:MAG: hypothetical protein R6X27_06965 [Candidatus Desulfacyla sp.]